MAEKTKKQLQAEAKKRGLTGYSDLNKKELVKLLATSGSTAVVGEKGPETVKLPAKTKVAKPKHTAGSLARGKAALLAELKSLEVSTERQAEIRAELEKEPMASTPILSHTELGRLED